jgi:hypothetical protein
VADRQWARRSASAACCLRGEGCASDGRFIANPTVDDSATISPERPVCEFASRLLAGLHAQVFLPDDCRVEDRTDKATSCAVALALDGPRDAAGSRANYRDEEGRAFFEMLPTQTEWFMLSGGETHENQVGVVDSVWSKEDDYRTLW